MFRANRPLELQVCSEDDYITDVAFNAFGNRVAFATSKQKISIWQKGNHPSALPVLGGMGGDGMGMGMGMGGFGAENLNFNQEWVE